MSSSPESRVDILVGSPRASFLENIQGILKGFYPYHLHGIKSVDEIFTNLEDITPQLALIDGQDGEAKVSEWLQSTKMNFETCKVIVLHDGEHPLNFTALMKNGADRIMHLAFDQELISDMVLELAPVEMVGDNIPITSLMPVDLRDMSAETNINFDVYVHLPANQKSILMRKSGDIVDEKHLEKFKSLRQQMYIKKIEKKAFFEYARTVLSLRDIPLPISMTEKFDRSKMTLHQIMGTFFDGKATDYQEGKLIFEKYRNIVVDFDLLKDFTGKELTTEISRFTNNNRTYYHDCICLSAYAALFAQMLGWSPEKRESLAIAGLLHNIGIAQLPASILNKPLKDLTPEDLKKFHYYPERSVNMVKNKKVPLPAEISEAIGQHRELNSGLGFPKKLPAGDLSELAKLMIYAYQFHELTSIQEGKKALSPSQAITNLRDSSLESSGPVNLVMATTLFKKWHL